MSRNIPLLLSFLAGSGIGFSASILIKPSKDTLLKPPTDKEQEALSAISSKESQEALSAISSKESNLHKFGLPSVVDVLERKSYTLVYNRAKRNAFYAGEYFDNQKSTSKSVELQTVEKPDRKHSHFKEDPDVPSEFRSRLADYHKSGFDRGHLVPAGDQQDQQAMNETFYLSNISPQVAVGFNRGYWASLERFVRHLASNKQFQGVHVYTGPLWLPQKDDSGKHYISYQVLGDPVPNTHVPTHFFKVILAEKDQDYRYMACFVLPNAEIAGHTKITDFMVPLEAVERASGIQFFPHLREKHKQLQLCSLIECKLSSDFKKAVSYT